MIDIDNELEWVTAWDKEDRHVGVISKHECVVDVDFVEELLTQVKRLREQQQKILRIAETNMTVEWDFNPDSSAEWFGVVCIIKELLKNDE